MHPLLMGNSIMKIISWNVNGIRAASSHGCIDWLKKEQPDILCVQETKAHPDQLSEELTAPEGYRSVWASARKKGYSGCAVFYKKEFQSVNLLGEERFDDEGRVQLLGNGDFTLINAYFPNSQNEGRRLDYKLDFCNALLRKCTALRKAGKNIILCGDFNIAHTPIDLARPKQNEKNPGYLPEERQWMTEFLANGYVDTFRMFTSEGEHYSWWSYRMNARAKNIGWRIDYFCVNSEFSSHVKDAFILDGVTGSDHCPVGIVLG